MEGSEYLVSGYSFLDALAYIEGQREAETVDYIRANTDLNDINKTIKLYHKLVERKTLKTVVGYAFLKELQERIINEGIVSRESIPCIKVEKDEKQLKAYTIPFEQEAEQKHLIKIEEYRISLKNSRIINIFLLGIIIAMILISVFSDRNIFSNYETKIINKYSAWEEELNVRQKALEEREALESVE